MPDPSSADRPMSEARCRRIVRERSGGSCEIGIPRVCLGKAHSASHRVPRSHGGEWTPANILDACGDGVRGCHGYCESHPHAAHALGRWRLWTNEDPATTPVKIGRMWVQLTDDGMYRLAEPEEIPA